MIPTFHLFAYGVAALLAAKLIQLTWQRHVMLAKTERLGGRAAVIPTRLPLGLDTLYKFIQANRRYEMVEYWLGTIERACGPNNKSWTAEMFSFGGIRAIMTADPENAKAIFATQFHDFGKGKEFIKIFHDLLGRSIFVSDGKEWSEARRAIRPIFAKDRVSDLDIFEKHTLKLISLVKAGEVTKIDKLLHRFTMDASTEFMFGKSVDSMGQPEAGFAKAFDEVMAWYMMKLRLGPLGFFKRKNGLYKPLAELDAIVEPYVHQALNTEKTDIENRTFVESLAAETRDPKHIRDAMMNMLLAGRDTTAGTLSWTMLELARNPQVVKKLQSEIQDMVGDAPPSYQDLKDMKYLNHVIDETLRRYPILGWNIRWSLKDTTLPHGGGPDGSQPIGIPKGTALIFGGLPMQRRRDLYPKDGPDPDSWVPERWESWTPKPWTYVPFSGGPRVCIGQNFARVEMEYALVRFLQRFESIESCDSPAILQSEMLITPCKGVNVIFHERKAA